MDSRERVFLSLDFKEPDRVPKDFWASEGFYAMLEKTRHIKKKEFLNLHDIDFRYIQGPRYRGPSLESNNDNCDMDIWQVTRRKVQLKTVTGGEESYSEVVEHPLADAQSAEEIEDYPHWPSPDWYDYSPIRRQCEQIRESGRAVVFMGDRLNRIAQLKPAMYLRGMEQIFVDLAVNPDIAEAVFNRLYAFYSEYLQRMLDAAAGGIDIVLTGDDFGTQNGLLLSPKMWRSFLADRFRDYINIVHSSNTKCMHHTCGAVTPLVPDMVECGLDVLQSLQPEGMSDALPDLKKRYKNQLCFHGGISVQQTLPRQTPQAVRREVEERVKTLAPGGGYILSTAHNVQADCPLENVDAMLSAYERFGNYS